MPSHPDPGLKGSTSSLPRLPPHPPMTQMYLEIPNPNWQEVGPPLDREESIAPMQPNSPPHQASITRFYHHRNWVHANTTSQILPFGTGGPVAIPSATDEQLHDAMSRREQHVCLHCGKGYQRPQELQRHVRDKHKPLHQCPYCHFSWSRPHKIKAHLMAKHAEKFTPKTLKFFKALRGQRIVEFLDTCVYPLNLEATQPCYPTLTSDVRVIPNATPPMPATLYHDLNIPAACSLLWSLDGPFHDIHVMHPQYGFLGIVPFWQWFTYSVNLAY